MADATVDSLFNYYNEFSNLLFNNYWEAHIIGKRAFRRSDLLIVSSDWCKQNAIKQYGCNPDKIQVVEFGANLDMSDVPALPKRLDNKKHYNIYWSGVNWERKGGNIALECCEELLRQGYDISFNITGMKELARECYQVDGKMKPFIHNYGFLSKMTRHPIISLYPLCENKTYSYSQARLSVVVLLYAKLTALDFLVLFTTREALQIMWKMGKMVICYLSVLREKICRKHYQLYC